jgi:hypothetical protein
MAKGELKDTRETNNPYKRWKHKIDRYFKLYTEMGDPLELWKPIVASHAAKFLKKYEIPPEQRRGSKDFTGGSLALIRMSLEQYAHNKPYEIVPALRRHLSAAEGASDIKYVYTYSKPGDAREYAIYLGREEEPGHDVLRDRIKYVEQRGMSPYEDDALGIKRTVENLFDEQDGPPVINAATMFDYDDYFAEESHRAKRWAVKDDSWLGQQYGDRSHDMENALPDDLKGVIRIYERPVSTTGFSYKLGEILGDTSPRSGRMWFEWTIRKPLIYAAADFLMEPLEIAMEKILPPDTMRNVVYMKSKAVSGTWRGMTNPRDTHLWYSG